MSCEGRAPPQCCLGSSLAAARSGAGIQGREAPLGAERSAAGAGRCREQVCGSARPGPDRRRCGSRAAPAGRAAAAGLRHKREPLCCCRRGTWARAGAGLWHSWAQLRARNKLLLASVPWKGGFGRWLVYSGCRIH